MGVILPILLNKNVLSNPVGGGLLGVYLIAYVLQSEVNVVLFDQFRANKLPQRKQGGRGWGILCSIAKRILPTDPEKTEDEYKQTSFRRRLIISIMDYWLLFVGFSICYWFWLPEEFSPNDLSSYSESLYFSIVTGTTLGYGEIHPDTNAQLLCACQALFSLLFGIIIISNILSLLPRTKSMQD